MTADGPWCVAARRLGSPATDHARHAAWRGDLETGLAETVRRTTERLAAEAAAWDAVEDEAVARGACDTCLRKSDWHHRPRFVRHRRLDFHAREGR